jgi:hypothetical protein
MSLHTATYKHRKVRITLRSGEVVIDNFVERTRNRWVVLRNRRIHVRDIRAFAPYRNVKERT